MKLPLFTAIIVNVVSGQLVEFSGPHPHGKAVQILNSILQNLDTDMYLAEVIPDRF